MCYRDRIIREELLYELSNATFEENASGFQEFVKICQKTLNHHAPTKQEFLRSNPFAIYEQNRSQTLMHRNRFHNEYLRNKTCKNKPK